MVSKTLNDFHMVGAADLVLSTKLRFLKTVLTDWKNKLDIKEGEELKTLKDDLERLESDMEHRDL